MHMVQDPLLYMMLRNEKETHTNTGVRTMHFGVYFKQVPSCDLYILFLQGSKHIRSYQLDRSDLGESRCQ